MKAKCNTTAIRRNGLQVEMVAACEIPFVPCIGQRLAVTPGGDYFNVNEVFWRCNNPDEIEVYLDELSGADMDFNYLVKQGWKKAVEASHAQHA